MLPPTIPIFPLPNAVLFPNACLPLHIFESRYRAMVADALRGDRIVGMVLLQPGFEAEYERRPAVFPIGCAGVITHVESLPDGRYNMILRGIEKFRITGEDHSRPYRLAHIDALPEPVSEPDKALLRSYRERLEGLFAALIERTGSEHRFPTTVADEDLVNALAQYVRLDPLERQALLERDGVLARGQALIELLEMKTMTRRAAWTTGSVH
jgi:Lon protease-like protein